MHGFPLVAILIAPLLALRGAKGQQEEQWLTPLLRKDTRTSDHLWTTLLHIHPNPERAVVIEVGMGGPRQCFEGAIAGFQMHCFEPSAVNMARIRTSLRAREPEVQRRVTLYQKIVSAESGKHLEFTSVGSTGDFVGAGDNSKAVSKVETISIDDFVDSLGELTEIYMIKVDVQGFEQDVFAGMRRALQNRRFRYILFEFWPSGMARYPLSPRTEAALDTGRPSSCPGEMILRLLDAMGYSLMDMQTLWHPRQRQFTKPSEAEMKARPLELGSLCHWYISMSEKYRTEESPMGAWTDFLAIR